MALRTRRLYEDAIRGYDACLSWDFRPGAIIGSRGTSGMGLWLPAWNVGDSSGCACSCPGART